MHFPGDDELESFPVVRDFAVGLEESGEGGRHVVFASGGLRLAGFPAWDHADRDLRHFTPYDVPMGPIDIPYEDADEGWRIVIFEHRGFVYVLEGDDPRTEDFETFFRVPADRYVQAWALIINAHNPITPLDESE